MIGTIGVCLSGCLLALMQAAERTVPTANFSQFGVEKQAWQFENRCGSNCLYIFLQFHGCPVAHEDLAAYCPIGAKGISLQALKELTTERGLRAQVVKTTPEGLGVIELPAIALLGEGRENHFILLCEVREETITFVDGSTGVVDEMDRKIFHKNWSGFLLVKGRDPWQRVLLLSSGGLGAVILVGLVIRVRKKLGKQIISTKAEASMPAGDRGA